MRFFKKQVLPNFRNRYESLDHGVHFSLERLCGYQWPYKVDTWKLPEFERLFIGARDYVTQPVYWQTLNNWTLYLGTELQFFLSNLYFFFFYTRTVIPTWHWQAHFETTLFSEYSSDIDVSHCDDLEEWDGYVPIDEPYIFLNKTFNYNYNNENNSSLVFDTLVYKIFFNFWIYIQAAVIVKLERLQFISDSDYIAIIRHALKVSSHKMRFTFLRNYLTNLLGRCIKHPVNYFIQSNNKIILKLSETVTCNSWVLKYSSNIFYPIKRFWAKGLKLSTVFVKPINVSSNTNASFCASLIRKNRVFTKSKYSRSRQYCKNIVLLGLLLNIVLMFGLNSGYYAILINGAYFIHLIYVMLTVYSIYVSYKYRLFF